MTFELKTEAAPAALADLLGGTVELRELPYGQMREAMGAADKPGQSADRLLGAALHVNGAPLGFDALQTVPGRFSSAIAQALQTVLQMHGLTGPEEDAQGEASPRP